MARILLFLVVAFLVWLAVRSLRGSGTRRADGDEGRAASTAAKAPEAIEQCAWCGAHTPVGAAVSLPDGRVYCTEAHREQARLSAAPPTRSGPGS